MLHDVYVSRAVSGILQRSERQSDIDKLLHTYVDIGVVPQLENKNNQIMYGRRGTGKTHVLRVLESRFGTYKNAVVVYIDARTLGSASQYTDLSLPLQNRCLSLFRDVLSEIHNALLDYIVDIAPDKSEAAFIALSDLASCFVEGKLQENPVRGNRAEEDTAESRTDVGVAIDPVTGGLARAGHEHAEGHRSEESITFEYEVDERILFPDLQAMLSAVLDLAEADLFVLFDEWSSIPEDAQPFLAELLRRSIIPNPKAIIKIASLEHRTNFFTTIGDRRIGFELGADISTAIDLDDYFVFDRNPEAISEIYSDVLFRHIGTDLPEGILKEQYRVVSGKTMATRMFTERATFHELARASEGVIRDLINIFTKSFFDSKRRGRDSIDKNAIVESARLWFEQDKSQHLSENLLRVLRRIVDEVIGGRKARSFLLPRELERHPVIQRLFDARVLHHMQRGYADKDNPGTRYNIYSLDYGTYVDLLNTSKQPQINLVEDASGTEYVVPFDDKRSIRRIILGEDVLSVE